MQNDTVEYTKQENPQQQQKNQQQQKLIWNCQSTLEIKTRNDEIHQNYCDHLK